MSLYFFLIDLLSNAILFSFLDERCGIHFSRQTLSL
jgi:hypothetical protein